MDANDTDRNQRSLLDSDAGLWRGLLAAVAAGAAYGLWAYFVNEGHGLRYGISAALVQGGYSFGTALGTTLLLERLRGAFGPTLRGSLTTVAISSTLLIAIAYGLHWMAGTPEILATMAPGIVIGTAYALVYVIALDRRERRQALD